jgi:hypothetical protein
MKRRIDADASLPDELATYKAFLESDNITGHIVALATLMRF